MRLLLDESVPVKLKRLLPDHVVQTVIDMGWSGVKNGELLALAAERFDAFVTVDKNLPYQQNLAALPLAVIVLDAVTNELSVLSPLVPALVITLASLKPRTYVRIGPNA